MPGDPGDPRHQEVSPREALEKTQINKEARIHKTEIFSNVVSMTDSNLDGSSNFQDASEGSMNKKKYIYMMIPILTLLWFMLILSNNEARTPLWQLRVWSKPWVCRMWR